MSRRVTGRDLEEQRPASSWFLGMAWVNYKKAYGMVSHSWLLYVVEMMGVADNVS